MKASLLLSMMPLAFVSACSAGSPVNAPAAAEQTSSALDSAEAKSGHAVTESAMTASATLRTEADDAYIYGYPLTLMYETMRVSTNAATAQGAQAPINQFASLQNLATPANTTVVRPNADTIYSAAWLDLSTQPMVVHTPDTGGRYYVMEMLDAWTNVFAAPGSRTTGTAAHDFAVVGPGFDGILPSGVTPIVAPTNMVWIITRFLVNGVADAASVNALQGQLSVTPLSDYGQAHTAAVNATIDPSLTAATLPPLLTAQLDPWMFFSTVGRLMTENPPSASDVTALEKFARIGLSQGTFRPSANASQSLPGVQIEATQEIAAYARTLGTFVNGWQVPPALGSYGTSYMLRAAVALTGLGANLSQDAVYYVGSVDSTGQPLDGASSYVIHFPAGQTPPVDAFWSVTMYDQSGYLVPNTINRYKLGSVDPLAFNADGSLDIHIQSVGPASQTAQANWLPAPSGSFNLTLRMYWPQQAILDGSWQPPPVQMVAQ